MIYTLFAEDMTNDDNRRETQTAIANNIVNCC